eukprot:s2269_g10.t1
MSPRDPCPHLAETDHADRSPARKVECFARLCLALSVEAEPKLDLKEQARRYDAQREALMDHSGTSFERNYEVYPVVEPPPLANLPVATGDGSGSDVSAEQLQRLRAEVSGLKSRSALVQRQMFEGLSSGKMDFEDFQDVGRVLEQLKVEPKDDAELAHKFSVYESYFSSVVDLRAELSGLWQRGEALLASPDAQTMRTAIHRVDSFDNLSIPERSRHWFVYHMMSTASNNHRKMQQIMEDLEELFERAQDAASSVACGAVELTDDPQLGVMEDIDAYNDGVKGNPSKGILAAAERGILDMDRQYNAVNFQYFAQAAEAGVTRAGAEASFKRRLCTSRLSFYIEERVGCGEGAQHGGAKNTESHGSRIFPRNILSQLSLLFYRRNDALRLPNGQVNELRVATCIRKAIPRMLRAIVLDVFQGDRNFTPHVEKAVRVYLALHQVAIKLLATFRKSYEVLYQSVLDREWIQQPFCAKSDAEWPDLEELLLGSSLCSVPWSLLREAFVRKLLVQNFLERLTYILSFFQAGPGKLPIQDMDKKYSRCAGTLPKQEREALVDAAKEGSGISSMEYVQSNVAAWRAAAPGPCNSEGPALPPSALQQLLGVLRIHGDGSAADETDEVELRVLCLTGEGVSSTVSRSMLGYDLRRLVSEKLPCKLGAKLVVHHVNGKLKLNESLGEQGIVGKSASLSCTYLPTNVYTAWRYACGFPNDEKEFALEGITHLEGATHGDYIHHLPCSLASMTFGHLFNQSLERVTLPSSLQSLSFDWEFNQSLERVTLPSSLQSLSFGYMFNQSLERVTLPSSLQSLSFSFKFNQSLELVTLPSSLQSLSFGYMFNQSLERVTLPSSLQSLRFGHCFNQSLERVTLPSSLQNLSFDGEFNQSLELVTLPSSLQSLSFGFDFNQSLEPVTLPSSLQSLSFGHCFNQSLERVTWPSSLPSLSFGFKFNQSLELVTLPSNLQSLILGEDFNQNLERVTWPSSLQSLSFGFKFNQSLERVTWPSSLQSLSFCFKFNQSLELVTLPSSLQSLSFGYMFNQSLERVTWSW